MYIYTYHERYYIVDCLYNMYIYIYMYAGMEFS